MLPTSQAKRIVIIEDQTAFRELLAESLRSDPAYKIVGESGDGQQACQLCLDLKPDLLVLDARLPGLSGVDILRRVSKQLKNTRVIIFSAYESPALVREMLQNGAHGFVEKTAGLGEFKKGLETIATGGTYFGPEVAALLRSVVANDSPTSGMDELTNREREILKLVAESNSTKEIAQKLGISRKTVDNHRTNLMRKLNLHDVASLTRYALEIGLIDNRGQTPAIAASSDITGSYSPLSIDSGVGLFLAANHSFSADWWDQNMKSDKIIRGKVSGSWKEQEGKVALYFNTKNRKGCGCEFCSGEVKGKRALILTRPSEFPLSSFFGDTYYRVESPAGNQ